MPLTINIIQKGLSSPSSMMHEEEDEHHDENSSKSGHRKRPLSSFGSGTTLANIEVMIYVVNIFGCDMRLDNDGIVFLLVVFRRVIGSS